MKTKQLLSPTGEKIGGVHPAVARKLVRSGAAEERDGQVHLAVRTKNPLQFDRKETRCYPIIEDTDWDPSSGWVSPAHCVLHLYVNDPSWGGAVFLEILTRGGGRLFANRWHQLAEDIPGQAFRQVPVEEWLSRLDRGEHVHPDGAELEPPQNIFWVMRPTPDGKTQPLHLWVALHYPAPVLRLGEFPEFDGAYPYVFMSGCGWDHHKQVVLDDWWHV